MFVCYFTYTLGPKTTKLMDELSLEFSGLVSDVAEILNKFSTNLNKLKLFLCTIKDSERSLLFSKQKSSEIHCSKTIYDMFYHLRGHWRWDSHHLLYILIKQAESQEALQRLNQFKNKIKYTTKLKELSDSFQSMYKSPPPGYTIMIAIIEKEYSEFTLNDCKELDEYLARFNGGETLLPPNIENFNSIKITWYIPIEAVRDVLSKVHEIKEIFQMLSISFFQIDQVVMWNKKTSYYLEVGKLWALYIKGKVLGTDDTISKRYLQKIQYSVLFLCLSYNLQ